MGLKGRSRATIVTATAILLITTNALYVILCRSKGLFTPSVSVNVATTLR